jgi:hypothetical protein
VYLMALFAFLLADHWLAPPQRPGLVLEAAAAVAAPAAAPQAMVPAGR